MIRDAQRDEEDGPEEGINTFNDKDMKETNAARKVNQLLNIYKISHATDVNSFKRYVLAKGGDTWDFVFNNYISKGMRTLVDAVEVCTELVDAESLYWNWLQSMENMKTPDLTKYHTVMKSQRFIYR